MSWLRAVSFILCSSVVTPLVGGTNPAKPVGETLWDDPVLRGHLVELLQISGNGIRSTERAAFIVREESGRIRCLVWPLHNGFQKETYHGTIPPNTVAIAHTHPREIPFPSVTDQKEAVRLGLPFLVVTPRNLYSADPDGRTLPIIRNRPWTRTVVTSAPQCELLQRNNEPRVAAAAR
ncbi:MAG TPA: hypothetical protein VMT00_11735 [Thermoanaerobaculia bacterium]|nr:hypothetical protein [Thermoanaerobaculia bacterium]